MAWSCSRKLRTVISIFRCERIAHSRLRRYIGAGIIILSAAAVFSVCFYALFNFILTVLNMIDAAIDNADRSLHSLEIQRFDDELHVETIIDPKHQMTRVFFTSAHPRTCTPRDTVTDFEKGTEVFVENDNCFIRLINNREESYKQQMLLFNVLDDVPLQQSFEPSTYEAVQHLQFTDYLYDLLGRRVAAQCNLRRLLWILPATAQRAEQLAACRCFDTLHARIRVCLPRNSELAKRANPWSAATPYGRSTERADRAGTGGADRHPSGLDRILMRPADMGLA